MFKSINNNIMVRSFSNKTNKSWYIGYEEGVLYIRFVPFIGKFDKVIFQGINSVFIERVLNKDGEFENIKEGFAIINDNKLYIYESYTDGILKDSLNGFIFDQEIKIEE